MYSATIDALVAIHGGEANMPAEAAEHLDRLRQLTAAATAEAADRLAKRRQRREGQGREWYDSDS